MAGKPFEWLDSELLNAKAFIAFAEEDGDPSLLKHCHWHESVLLQLIRRRERASNA
jgi:hypothetical protein